MPLYQAIKNFVYVKEPIDFSRLYQMPTLNKRENIERLLAFLKQTKEFFEDYLEKINQTSAFLEKNNDFSSTTAFPILRQLELVQHHLYSTPQYGEILEMWSASPIYHFLKKFKRIRNQSLNESTIRESFEIYEDYFHNIQPLVEDIIKHFKRTMGRLVKLVSSGAYGSWLIRLREGVTCMRVPHNLYMFEAVKLRGLLYTLPELEREFPNIFENPAQPLVLEVGCYMGHTVIELAEHNPGINVLGLDIKYKRVVKSVRKIKKAKLTNAKIALCNVMGLLPILPEHSVYGMFIFFPDPWIKDRHKKHRYLKEHFFSLASSRLAEGGFIWLKTDQENYFDEITAAAKQYNFSVLDCLPGKIAQREYRTLFENMFIEKNTPYYQVILSR
jgi:tRNA (guanine-N7-)-methyltransferase